MDTSMIIGLALAGSIVMLSGNKNQKPKTNTSMGNRSEFVVSVNGDGGVSISPKKKNARGS